MTLEGLEYWLRYCGLDNAVFSEDSDGQVIINTNKQVILHTYTDSAGQPRSYETLEDLDYIEMGDWVDG